MGISLGAMPDVTPWMTAPHGPVEESAKRLQTVAARVDESGKSLQVVLAESGGVLGWRSRGAEAARVPLVQADTEIGMLRDVTTRAAEALLALSAAMAQHGPELTKLITRRKELETQAGNFYDESGSDGAMPLIEDTRAIDRQIQEHVEQLATVDRSTRDKLNQAAAEYHTLEATDREDEWVGDMGNPEVMTLLGRYGVTESATDRAMLDQIMLIPPGPAGDEELRVLLGQMNAEELADFLLRHPDVGRRLAAPLKGPGSYPPGSPESLLATAIAAGKSLPPKEAVAAVRAVFAKMSPEERRKLALLYPGLVGNLDGAPLDDRAAANRVQIGVALDDERGEQLDHARAVVARSDRDEFAAWWNDDHARRDVGIELKEPLGDQTANNKRIDYYHKLLYEEVDQPGGSAGAHDQHQILYFDNAHDGKIAEMWGTMGPDTRNVAVFVPGTTSDMETFENDSEKMRALAGMDPSGQTVAIAWQGVDLPDSVVAEATRGGYAESGGPALRNFVWGLDVPQEQRLTVIGHSYGGAVVGVADREGLEADAVVHVASAGTGDGVDSAADYPDGVDGKERYSMTAPGDTIWFAQEAGDLKAGHGSDPDDTPGFTRLETGRYLDDYKRENLRGQIIDGTHSHSRVTQPGTTSFENIYGVVTGGEVTTYTPPKEYVDRLPSGLPIVREGPDPYRDPNFEGPKKDIPDDAGR